jgi:nitrous oxidase accessory protein NosD
LYVGGSGPNNYSMIQDAIDNASNGDIIFVYSGIYYENVIINLNITLNGEDKYSTIIDGNFTGDVVCITESANGGTIKGFTIKNSGEENWYDSGIELYGNFDCIAENIIIDNLYGINDKDNSPYFYGYCNNISHNIITDNKYGICVNSADEFFAASNIFENYLENNRLGIIVSYYGYSDWIDDNRNKIYQNIITNNLGGIAIDNDHYQNVYHNNITKNKYYGISLSSIHGICYQNNIYENNIEENQYGIELYGGCTGSTYKNNLFLNNLFNNNIGIYFTNGDGVGHIPSGNKFYQNNFISNNISAQIDPDSPISRFCYNNWNRNYWERPRILPKKITAPAFIFSILNIDWRPVIKPYDIGF